VSAVALGLVLALGASVALNASFLLQHAGSVGAAAVTPRRPLATLRSLLGSRLWAGGAALGCAGWAMHIGALARAPLSLVQAFVAGGLALCVPMAAVGLGHRAAPAERRAAVVMVVGLVLLAYGLHGAHRDAAFASAALAGYLAALVVGAAALLLPSATLRERGWELEALGVATAGIAWLAGTATMVTPA